MEDTLGRRISALRKSAGMTQDQLAEKLGITAQAVSKWENDQSCPDITILPRLADLFGVSVDTLLGRENVPVRQDEVVEEATNDKKKGHWNWGFRFKEDQDERAGSIAFALWVILCGGLLLAGNLLQLDYDFWDILWPSGLIFVGLSSLFKKFSFFGMGCLFFGGLFLVKNMGILPFDLGDGWVFPVLLIFFGLSLLPAAFMKKKPTFSFVYNTDGDHEEDEEDDEKRPTSSVEFHDGWLESSYCFGNFHQPVATDLLQGGSVDASFSQVELDLRDCKAVAPHCKLELDCAFGEIVLLVPRRYKVNLNKSAAFGDVRVQGEPAADAEPIRVEGSASFGQIIVRYI